MSAQLTHKHPRWLHSKPSDFNGSGQTSLVDREDLPDLGLPRVVLLDGHLQRHLSDEVEGIRVVPLDEPDDVIQAHLGKALDDDEVAAAFEAQGALLDFKADATVHLIHLCHGDSQARVLVHARDNATATLVQHIVGNGTQRILTELQAHQGATLRRDLIQETAGKVLHMTFTSCDRDATISDVHLDLDGVQRRNTTISRLDGAGSHVDLHGLYLTAADQRTDHWTRVDHAVPDTTSREMYKGVLTGKSRGSFTGNVLVRKDAQRTNAEQENRNLLLSRKALAESTPQLEIFADDVQCAHGSTVGQLDEKALFFLRARGIGKRDAEQILTQAFAGEVVDAIHHDAVRKHVMARIETWFEAST